MNLTKLLIFMKDKGTRRNPAPKPSLITIILIVSTVVFVFFSVRYAHSRWQNGVVLNKPDAVLSVGTGFLSPYKVIADPLNSDRIYIINGQGESGGQGLLHILNSATLRESRAPLVLGANPSDIDWVGSSLLISCRGSNELYLVDPEAWQVLDKRPTVPLPISIAPISPERAIVVSSGTNLIQLVSLSRGRIETVRTVNLPALSYNVTFDPGSRCVYVNQTDGTISELKVDDLSLLRRFKTGGEPSFGSLVWNGHLLLTDRDGYLHSIDLSSGSVYSLDLSLPLKVDRNSLPLRDIEPMGLIISAPNRLIVINGRQKSLVLSLDAAGKPAATALAMLPSGAYGAYLLQQRRVILTNPSANKLILIDVDKNGLPLKGSVQYQTTGTGIKSALRSADGANPSIVVLDSSNTLHVFDERAGKDHVIAPPQGYFWDNSLPVQPGDKSSFILVAVGRKGGNSAWVRLSPFGNVLDSGKISLQRPIFSLRTSGSRALLTGRLHGQIETIDFQTGENSLITLSHSRPRTGLPLVGNRWLVIHDTYPDIGFTTGSVGTTSFQPYSELSWLTDMIAWEHDTIIVSGFNGFVTHADPLDPRNGEIYRLPMNGVENIVNGLDGGFWSVSSRAGSAVHMLVHQKRIDMTITTPNIQSILPAPERNGVWAVTDKELMFFTTKDNLSYSKQ